MPLRAGVNVGAIVDVLYDGEGLPEDRELVIAAAEMAIGDLTPGWQDILQMCVDGVDIQAIVGKYPELKNHVLGPIWIGQTMGNVREAIASVL